MANKYTCSDGVKLTENQILTRLKMLRKSIFLEGPKWCEGCRTTITHSIAHIISKSRAKQINKTELIWDRNNVYPSCFKCNSAIENPKGQEWKNLHNKDYCLEFIKKHDKELYQKFINNI